MMSLAGMFALVLDQNVFTYVSEAIIKFDRSRRT